MLCAIVRVAAISSSTHSWGLEQPFWPLNGVGRRAYGLELDPLYVDATIRRWQAFTKCDALLDGTELTFDEVVARRSSKKSGGSK